MLKRTNVLVVRNSDEVTMVIPYKSYRDLRDSKEPADYSIKGGIVEHKKLTLLGECDDDGNLIQGNPNLLEIDKKAVHA